MAQEGGKLLGQGSYGCAFTPPLKCRGKPKKGEDVVNKRVGKITTDLDSYWEVIISKRLAQNPLASNYFILSEDICEVDTRKQQNEPELEKCLPIEGEKLTNFKQLSMPYGGLPLNMVKFNIEHFDIVGFMKHLLEAGAILLLSGTIHMDLHMANVVVDEYDVPRIIDFGLSVIPDKITKDVIDFIKHEPDFTFHQEPPEASLLWAILANATNESTTKEIIHQKKIFQIIRSVLGVENSAEDLTEFWLASKSLRAKDGLSFLKTYWPQYDAWSIGVVMLHLLRSLTFYRGFQNNRIYTSNKVALEKILVSLLEANPMRRFDAIEALNELVKTVPSAGESYVLNTFASEWIKTREQQRNV
jgi:serine/threonine protein kinase